MTKPTEQLIDWEERFDSFFDTNADVRFAMDKMSAKIGEVATVDMEEAIKDFIHTEIAAARKEERELFWSTWSNNTREWAHNNIELFKKEGAKAERTKVIGEIRENIEKLL